MSCYNRKGNDKEAFTLNKEIKRMLVLLVLLMLPVLSLADAPVLLVQLPENALMVENVEFENGDFIQTYQLDDGVAVQLLRYTDFEMSIEDLIASDWPLNVRSEISDMTDMLGYPAQHAHVWQLLDEGGYPIRADEAKGKDGEHMMELDLVLVHVDGTTLIYHDAYLSGQRGDITLPIIESLKVEGGENAEVG